MERQTVIVTGASGAIGKELVMAFLKHGYAVVAMSRSIVAENALPNDPALVAIDGDLADPASAERIVAVALEHFGKVDALVNSAGLFFSKPFLEYTAEDLQKLSQVNVEGFFHLTQRVVRQMVAQGSPGSVVTLTTSRVVNPIAGSPAAVPMLGKGGLEAATRSLAIEFAPQHIRFNAVAPGTVDTPMQKDKPAEALRKLSPMGVVVSVAEIVQAVLYLTQATSITGEVLHVDGGAHVGKW